MKKLIKKCEKIYIKDILTKEQIDMFGINTDYGNRDLAISYINGELYEGDTHKDTLQEYLNNNKMNVELDHSEGFVQYYEQEDVNLPMGFASLINGTDGKTYIAIYNETLFNITLNDFVNVLKIKYPKAILCTDDFTRDGTFDDAYMATI